MFHTFVSRVFKVCGIAVALAAFALIVGAAPALAYTNNSGVCLVDASEGYTGAVIALNDSSCTTVRLGAGTFDGGYSYLVPQFDGTVLEGTLDADGNSLTTLTGSGYGIISMYSRSQVTVRDLRIQGTGSYAVGFYIYNSTYSTFSNVTMSGVLWDYYLYYANSNTVSVPCSNWSSDYVTQRVYQYGSANNTFSVSWPASGLCTASDNAFAVGTDPVSIAVLANDSQQDNLPLSIASFTQPTNGSVTQDGNNLVYTANSGFHGTDTFSYLATDGNNSSSATVTIIVKGTCNVPAFAGYSGVQAALNDSACGVVHLGAGTFAMDSSYLVPQFNGTVIEGTVDDNGTLLTVLTGSGYELISISDRSQITVRNLQLQATGAYTYSNIYLYNSNYNTFSNVIMSGGQEDYYLYYSSNNTVSVPCSNWSSDYVTQRVYQYGGTNNTFSVSWPASGLCVSPDEAITDGTDPVLIAVLANDSQKDNLPLSIASFTQPAHGTAVQTGDIITYTANAYFVGEDFFDYTAVDAFNNFGTARVTIGVKGACLVSATNDGSSQFWGPQGLKDAIDSEVCTSVHIGAGSFDLSTSLDITRPGITIEGTTDNAGGLLTKIISGDFIYSAAFNISAPSVTVRNLEFDVSADTGVSAIDINSANDVTVDGVIIGSGQGIGVYFSGGITLKDNILSGLIMQYSSDCVFTGNKFTGDVIFSGDNHIISGNTFYSPSPLLSPEVRVSFEGGTNLQVINNKFTGVYDSSAGNDAALLAGTGVNTVQVTNSIFLGNTFSTADVRPARDWYMNIYSSNNTFSIPCADWVNNYYDNRTIHGGWSENNTYSLAEPPNGICAATAETATTGMAPVEVNLLLNSFSRDGITLSVASVGQPAHGSVVLSGGIATYTAVAGFVGYDSFTYTVTDGNNTSTGLVKVRVMGDCAVSASNDGSKYWGWEGLYSAALEPLCINIHVGAGTFDLGGSYSPFEIPQWKTGVVLDGAVDNSGAPLTLLAGTVKIKADAAIVRHLKIGTPGTFEYLLLGKDYTRIQSISVDENVINRLDISGRTEKTSLTNNQILGYANLSCGKNCWITQNTFHTNVAIQMNASTISNNTFDSAPVHFTAFATTFSDNVFVGSYLGGYGVYLTNNSTDDILSGNAFAAASHRPDYDYVLNRANNNDIFIPCSEWYSAYPQERVLILSGSDNTIEADPRGCLPVAVNDILVSSPQSNDRLISVSDLLANDYWADGRTELMVFTLSAANSASGAELRLVEQDGEAFIEYLAALDFTGEDSFDYTVCGQDSEGCATANVSFEVTASPTGIINVLYQRHYTGSGNDGQNQPQAGAFIYTFNIDCAKSYTLDYTGFEKIIANCQQVNYVRITDTDGKASFGLAPGGYIIFAVDVDEANNIQQAAAQQVNVLKEDQIKNITLQGNISPTLSRSILGVTTGNASHQNQLLGGNPPVIYRSDTPDPASIQYTGTLEITANRLGINQSTNLSNISSADVEALIIPADSACLANKKDDKAFRGCDGQIVVLNSSDGKATVPVLPGNYVVIAHDQALDIYARVSVSVVADQESAVNFISRIENVGVPSMSGYAL